MHVLGLRLVAALVLCATTCHAAPPGAAPRPRVPVTLRFVVPFTEHTVVNGGDRTDSTGLGVALGVLLRGTWGAEVGVAGRSSQRFFVRSLAARCGVTPTLVEGSDEEGGFTLGAGPWLGYRYETRGASDDGYEPRETVHAATGALRAFFTRWWSNGNGLELSLGIGFVVPVARAENATWSYRVPPGEDYRHGIDLGGTVGWSF